MRKKILILAESLRINETSSGIVSSNVINALKNKLEVTVLYEKSFDYPVTWLVETKLIPVDYPSYQKKWWELIPKVRGVYAYLKGYNPQFKMQVETWKKEINKVLSQESFDLIWVLGSGMSFVPHWAVSDIKLNIPVVYNFHDPYPRSWYPEPYRQKQTPVNYHQQKKTVQILKNAHKVTFPSILLKKHMAKYIPEINNKYVILPHIGSNLKNLPDKQEDSLIYLPDDKFNIMHAGTLLGPRKVAGLFEAFDRLSSEEQLFREKAELTILGKIARENKVIKNIVENYTNIKVYDLRVSYKRSLELIKKANLSLVIEAEAEFSPFMPGKLADILYNKKPVLALTPKKSEVRHILGQNYPYIAEVNNTEQIYSALKLAWEKWKENQLILLDAYRLKNYVSPENFLKRFEKIISKSR